MDCKFKLGDVVESLGITGLSLSGRICSIMEPQYFIGAFIGPENLNNYVWNKVYSNWIKEPIYTVLLDSPSKVCSYKEFLEGTNMEESDYSKIAYETKVKLADSLAYPEQDLIAYGER